MQRTDDAIDGGHSQQAAVLRFLLRFHNVLIYVLLGSAAITAFLGHWVDTGVILAVNTLVVMEIFHLFFIRNFYSTSLN